MKFNKIAILCLILAILTFGAVSAVDDASIDGNVTLTSESDVASDNLAVDDNINLNSENGNDPLQDKSIITPDNIGNFDDDIIPSGEYKFEGVFENTSSFVLFENGCVVDASEAEFVNVAVILNGNVNLKGLTITSTKTVENSLSPGALVYVTGDNNFIEDLTISYYPGDNADAYALYVSDANNFTLLNSNINFTGVSLNTYYNYAVKIINSQFALIEGNIIRANLPILDVDYNKGEPGLNTDLVLNIGIKESDDLNINGNTFFANVIARNGDFPTLDCFMLESCNRVNIINNTINETDFFTSSDDSNYLNVLDMYYSSNVLVKNNSISVETNGGVANSSSAYPIQVTGPYEDVIIDGNELYAYCRGPALGIYSQNFYGDTEILIQNNKIDVTGRATSQYPSLVSGIELQDNIARVYNNDIKTKLVDGYQNGDNLYGISYAQILNDAHNYDIRKNAIETQGKYTIYLLSAQNVTILNNSLVSSTGEGDDTINVGRIEGTSDISGNYGRKSNTSSGGDENVVTCENFFEFFEDDGSLKENIEFDELIFKGEFNAIVSPILILTPITITGDNATLTNMRIQIHSSNVCLNNLTLIADTPLGSLIYIVAGDVRLDNLNINYSAGTEDAVAVDIKECNDVYISNSKVFFESHVVSDNNVAIAVQVVSAQDIVINNNNITTKLPCIEVNNYDSDYYVMGSNNVNPIRFKDCSNLRFTGNVVNSTTNKLSAEFPTIQSIYIIGCSNSVLDHNSISMVDEFTPEGRDNYMYGIDFGYNTNVTFSYNIFNMYTKGGKDAAGTAYAFQGVSSDIVIKGNTIISKSHGPNLGIYITSLDGETSEALIEDNFINVTGWASPSGNWALVSGVEIQNGNARIYNNTIYTYNFNEYNPASYCYGISYAQWMYGQRSFDVRYNTVYTEGKYSISVIDADFLYTSNNRLFAHDLEGDYSINLGNCTDIELDNNYPYVPKSDANIQIEVPDDVKFGETIVISVTADTNSSMLASINGERVDIVNGKITYEVVKGGLNTINIYSRANVEFNAGNETKLFNVIKSDTFIKLDAFANVKVGDTIVISPETNSDGELTFKVNGEVVDGSFTVLSNGSYVVSVESAETDNFKAGFNSTSFVVFKDASSVDVSLVAGKEGEISVVYVDVTDGAGGIVVVNVNGTEYSINVSDKKLELVLDAGEYPVFAAYMGNNKYNASVSEVKYLIVENKLDAIIKISIPDNVKVGDTVVIAVETDSDGELTFKVNGEVVDGSFTVLSNGFYVVSVESAGTDIYKAGFNSTSFVVFKDASSVDVSLVAGKEGEISVVYVDVTDGAGGIVVVNVNGTEYSINVSDKKLELVLDAGEYPVFAAYMGDNKYNASVSEVKYLIVEEKLDANIKIELPESIKVGETVVINVTADTTSTLVVRVDGEIFTLDDGKITYNADKGGVHIINVFASSNGEYKQANETQTFNANRKDAFIVINNFEDVKVGDTIVLSAESDSDGELTFKVNGEVVNRNYTVMSNGTYFVSVESAETENYNAGFANTSFTVFKEKSDVDMTIVPARAGEKSIILINVTDGANGTVIVSVNGTEYPINVSDGKLELVLGVGEYPVFARYVGNNMYEESTSEIKNLIVEDKLDANIRIEVPDCVTVGETIIINVTADTTSALVISIDGKNISLIDGKVTYTIVKDGMHTVNVFALETGDYKKANESKTFNAVKSTSSVNVDVVAGKALEESLINIEVTDGATGKISVKLNDVEVYNGFLNETGSVSLGNLTSGSYAVNVTYLGDDYFQGSSDVKEFIISKAESYIFASSIDITEGEIARLTVNVKDGAIGKVLVVVDGRQYYGDISDNVVIVNISDLSFGEHDVNITYLGDEKYYSSFNNTLITVKKQISADDLNIITEIPAGSNYNRLTVGLPSDATGYLTVIVDGEVSYTKYLENGVATINVDELPAGNHNIQVIYSGDDKYGPINNTVSITISEAKKQDAVPSVPVAKLTTKIVAKKKTFKAKVKVKKYSITLKAGNNPVKNVWVTLKIKGKTYKAKTNSKGKATFKIKKLTKKGKYSVVVKFSGNDGFKPTTKKIFITIKK